MARLEPPTEAVALGSANKDEQQKLRSRRERFHQDWLDEEIDRDT